MIPRTLNHHPPGRTIRRMATPSLIAALLFVGCMILAGAAYAQPAPTQPANHDAVPAELTELAPQWSPSSPGLAAIHLGGPWQGQSLTPQLTATENAWTASTVSVQTAAGGAAWCQTPLHLMTAGAGTTWAAQDLRLASAPAGPGVTDPTRGLTTPLAPLRKVTVGLPWALATAHGGRWDEFAPVMTGCGLDPKALAEAAVSEKKPVAALDGAFGGDIDPTWTPEVLQKRLARMKTLGFSCPIVPVRRLGGDWRGSYDALFKALDGQAQPMLGLCLREMDLPDLLATAELLRRYEGKFHSVIVNYDLTNGHVDGPTTSPAFREATEKVALALALVHRASPSSYAWLAVGYHRTPDWKSWVKSFDAQQYSGLLLSGGSAVAACAYPQTAAQVRKAIGEQAGDKPVGLIGFRLHTLDALLFGRDDLGLAQYESLRASLKQAGIAPLHISYTAGH